MKKRILLGLATATTLAMFAPTTAEAMEWFKQNDAPTSAVEGDAWIRDVGDGEDTFYFKDGKWELTFTTSKRREEAMAKYNETREQAFRLAAANPDYYSFLSENQKDTVLLISEYYNGYVTIPKELNRNIGLAYYDVEFPELLPVLHTNETISGNNENNNDTDSSTETNNNSNDDQSENNTDVSPGTKENSSDDNIKQSENKNTDTIVSNPDTASTKNDNNTNESNSSNSANNSDTNNVDASNTENKETNDINHIQKSNQNKRASNTNDVKKNINKKIMLTQQEDQTKKFTDGKTTNNTSKLPAAGSKTVNILVGFTSVFLSVVIALFNKKRKYI